MRGEKKKILHFKVIKIYSKIFKDYCGRGNLIRGVFQGVKQVDLIF
jgi:hypothetical protein